MQEIAIEFVYSRQQKMKEFSSQGEKGKFSWVEVIIFAFFDAVATVDVLPANNNDKYLDENRTVHFARLLNRCLILGE